MQEIKVGIISNGAASTAQALKTLVDQGYIIDAFSIETVSPAAQTKTIVTIVHRERNEQWN